MNKENNTKYKIGMLIVLYGTEVKDSQTLNALSTLELPEQMKLVIWNNGPKSIEYSYHENFDALDIEFKETIKNESLAIIYNIFLKMINASKYILLDHDSNLTQHYIDELSDLDCSNIGVPIISSFDAIRSPSLNGKAYSKGHHVVEGDLLTAIGSGVVIGNDVCHKLINTFGTVFDENFYLYGVDTTFFYRVNKALPIAKIKIISGFEHSLSRLEEESVAIKSFRKKELSYDLGLTLRYYSKGYDFYYRLFSVVGGYLRRWLMKERNSIHLTSFLKAFISGKHYRSLN